jgi:aminopeptidase 2
MSAAASTPQGWTSGLLLSTTATPSKYDVALAPDLVKFTFQGQVRIDLVVNQPTNELVAHSFELAYAAGRSFLFAQGAKTEPLQTATSIELDEASQRVRFVFAQTIQPGSYTLSSVFTGILNDQLCGFYRSAYTSARTGKPAFMAVTQFEVGSHSDSSSTVSAALI